jgi:hypothetical protein
MRVAASSTSIQGQVAAAGDGDEQAAGAAHRGRRRAAGSRWRLPRRGSRGSFAGGLARAHHRLAHFAHDRAHVGEIEVDEAFLDHQVGDAGNAGIEHLVGHGEGVGEGRLLVGDAEQVLVGNDDQRVDGFF